MKVAAIIAEYNPFHNGHKYLIEETRRLTGADYVLALMSGNFVQRGAPSLCHKYLRTRMALSCGADAVLELPTLYALSSAEFFASGSVSLLNALGTVDYLSFGSESGDITLLTQTAKQLVELSPAHEAQITGLLKEGYSYPAARAQVFSAAEIALNGQDNYDASLPSDELTTSNSLLCSPNNILGLEYCKALNHSHSSIIPFTVKRMGNDYHQIGLSEDASSFGSASAIRKALETPSSASYAEIMAHVPKEVYALMEQDNLLQNHIISDDFSALLHYKLLSEQKEGFSQYLDCTPDLSDKICKYLPEYTTLSDFILKLKSKDLTYTRISRVLFHILLNITYPDWYQDFSSTHRLFTPYARLLGFRKDATPLLSSISKNSSVPLLSKPADASAYLDEKAYALFSEDVYCASVYETVRFHKTGQAALNEFRQSPIIL